MRQALQGAGLVAKGRKRGVSQATAMAAGAGDAVAHRRRQHQWFQDDGWHDLIVLDDATSEIYYAQLVEENSTPTVMPRCARSSNAKAFARCIRSRQPLRLTPKAGGQQGMADAGGAGRCANWASR